ncbi:hypothetical protein AM588_10010974 [Phytophthora nicotianae]|uniref:Uncharacterized protein n=1 Tax=Phytophthora nicotianae TaxID=4792 RepID=A0A0W8DSX3_PHYNI|nr:hypothetical protein AM588_10010974 [Phytophthora nicotianae]
MATGKRSEAPSEAVQVQQKHPQQQLDGVMGVDDTVVAEPQEPLLPMHSYKQMADGDQAENEDADTNATAVLREKLLIPKVRTFSMLDAASTSQLGRYLEDEEALHPPLEPVGSSSSLHTSLLSSNGIPVSTRFFEGKTHTDPIIEDPIVGDDFLLDDVMAALKAQAPVDPITGKPRYELGARPQEKRFYPKLLVRVARKINPF